jgi:hypothetical protein
MSSHSSRSAVPDLPSSSAFQGVAVVIGAQDTAQIRAVYGQDQAKSWFGMTGTKIITRINASEAAEEISRLIGEQEVERRTQSTTRASGRPASPKHQREVAAWSPFQLASRLGRPKAALVCSSVWRGRLRVGAPLHQPAEIAGADRMPADWTRPQLEDPRRPQWKERS